MLPTLAEFFQSAGVFLVGLVVRLLAFVAIVVVASIPILAVFAAVWGVEGLRRRILGLVRAGDLLFRRGFLYTTGHTWIRRESRGTLRLGLDDLAQRLVPDPERIDLPAVGSMIRAGAPVAAVVAAGGRRAVIPAPFSGLVLESNAAVARHPARLNHSPYQRGWLVRMRPTDDRWVESRSGESARAWMSEEGERFHRFLENELQTHAADGGAFVAPPASLLSDDQWQRLTQQFLGGNAGR